MIRWELALHEEKAASIVVSRPGAARAFALPKREIVYARMPKRFVEGPGGLKLQLVEVEMPEWLAKDRGLR